MGLYKVLFEKQALDDLSDIDEKIVKRIVKKIRWFSEQQNPLSFASHLTNFEIGEYRFRIGDYRIIFDYDSQKKIIIILKIGHRSTIYK